LARTAAKHGVKLYLTGTSPEVRRELTAHGVAPSTVHYKSTIERALHEARSS